MKWLIRILGKLVGIHFAPDNHVVPVVRLERYHRVEGPGFFWIIPLLERTLSPVKTSIYVGNFIFEEILTRDNVPFKVKMTVLFTFKPVTALKSAAAVLVRGGEDLLKLIVKDYTSQGLRRLAAKFDAEELGGHIAMSTIERNLGRSLTAEMRALGIAPLKSGGILIKEAVAPEKFKRGVLNARRLEAILQALTRYPVGDLIQQAIQAGFVTGLEDLESELTLLSTLSPLERVYPPYPRDIHGMPVSPREHSRWNGH